MSEFFIPYVDIFNKNHNFNGFTKEYKPKNHKEHIIIFFHLLRSNLAFISDFFD